MNYDNGGVVLDLCHNPNIVFSDCLEQSFSYCFHYYSAHVTVFFFFFFLMGFSSQKDSTQVVLNHICGQ